MDLSSSSWYALRLDRLGEADDQVRLDIEAGLATGQPVVPVMLEDTAMPRAAELPESMASFHFRHGRIIRADPYYEQDADRADAGPRSRPTATAT